MLNNSILLKIFICLHVKNLINSYYLISNICKKIAEKNIGTLFIFSCDSLKIKEQGG